MSAYIIRRILYIIPILLLVTIIVFGIVRVIPGNVIDLMISEMPAEAGISAEEATAENIRHKLGLDQPIHVQYGKWLASIFQGDLGKSLWSERSVTESIKDRIVVSFELGFFAIIIALLFALPIGIFSAIRQDTKGDYIGRSIAILAISLPSFWIATIVIVYPAVWWNWTTAIEYIPFVEDPLGNLAQFLLPAVIMGLVMSGTTMRMTRTMMLEVLRQDYIRTAWSKGLRERVVIFRHALKNALIPVVTMVGLLIPVLIGGSVVIETIFCLPGIGLLVIEAIRARDYPIISGINLITATFVLAINLGVDLTYAWLDPRIRYK
jgi:peptide/nickel transport system permease protein